ncbi:MAG: SIMPL domain-containing protein [Paracoccaceae bacterium]
MIRFNFFIVLLLAPSLVAAQTGTDRGEGRRTVSVTGEGSVEVAPDRAFVGLGASAEDESAVEAMDEVSSRVEAVIEALHEAGVADEAIATTAIALSPIYDRSGRSSYSDSSGEPGVRGYRATNRLRVRLDDLDAVGRVLDAATRAGATDIGAIAFDLADPAPVEAEARRAAFADARERAALYAEAAGARLGPALSIADRGGGRPISGIAMEAQARAVPVMPGERAVTATVDVTFALE